MSIALMTEKACALCGDAGVDAVNAVTEYTSLVPGASVCNVCAERIANAFHMKHASQWLTWPNSSAPPKYKKDRIDGFLARKVHERYEYRCVSCASFIDLTCDHVVPESKGGVTEFENLQTMCRSCNSKKGACQ